MTDDEHDKLATIAEQIRDDYAGLLLNVGKLNAAFCKPHEVRPEEQEKLLQLPKRIFDLMRELAASIGLLCMELQRLQPDEEGPKTPDPSTRH